MRRISMFRVILGLAISLSLSLTASAVELADNGGFETGDFTGWEQFPNGGTQVITSVNVFGSFAANLNVSGGGAIDNLLKQANKGIGVVTPGLPVTISFDARGRTTEGGVAFAEFFSEIDGGGTSASEILGGAPLVLDDDPEVWRNYVFNTVAGPDVSGGVTLQLKASCGAVANCVSDVYFDNASITVVPEPAAMGLLGLGGLGMLLLRRRR